MPIVSIRSTRAEPRRYARVYVPRTTLITAWEFLRSNGERYLEQLCFLAGRVVLNGTDVEAQVTSCVLPLTTASCRYVTLTTYAQTAVILDSLEARRELPIMSLHTHGDGGYGGCGPRHSVIDDHGVALTPEDGIFSGVVSYYALGSPFDFLDQTTFYEQVDGEWVRLSREEREKRVIVHNDSVRIVPSLPVDTADPPT